MNSTTKNKRKYTIEEKNVLDRDFALYGDYVTPAAKRIVSSNQASQPSNSYGISSTFTPSANYTNAMNLTNSLLSHMVKTKPVDSMKAMIANIQNRPKFSYDINKDPMFQQALSSAQKSGRTAMKDTMGQAAALTGGYGSSYSSAVGSQAYNNHLQQVYDNVPQYYNMALQKYQMETDDLYRQYALMSEANNAEYQMLLDLYNMNYSQAQDIYNKEYAAWSDANDIAYRERDWNYGVERDSEADQRYAEEFAYQKERDSEADQRYAEEFAYQKERDAKADERYLNENDWDGNGVVNTLDQAYYNEFVKGSEADGGNGDAYSLTDTEIKEISRIFNSKGGGEEGVNAVYDYLALKGKTPTTDEAVGIVEKAYNYKGYDDTDSPTSATTPAKGLVDGFKSKKGDNFDVSVGDKTYRVENQGEVTDTKLTDEFDKLNINDGEAFLYNADNRVYVKKGNKYYKTGATEVLGFNTPGHSNLKSALYSIVNGGK